VTDQPAKKKRGAPFGNRNAAKDRQVRATLIDCIDAAPTLLQQACFSMLQKAADGDVAAFREVADRIDGKAVQQTMLTAEVTTNTVEQMTDEQLAIIAAGGGVGTAEASEGAQQPDGVH
jgi:predicted polyphosphate/ATP-dependent NAD kinase